MVPKKIPQKIDVKMFSGFDEIGRGVIRDKYLAKRAEINKIVEMLNLVEEVYVDDIDELKSYLVEIDKIFDSMIGSVVLVK